MFTNGQAADLALGQLNLDSYKCNDGNGSGLGAESLCSPASVAVDSSGNLYVGDSHNIRDLIYSDPFAGIRTEGRAADFPHPPCSVSGSFSTDECSYSATLASLCAPAGVVLDPSNRLL